MSITPRERQQRREHLEQLDREEVIRVAKERARQHAERVAEYTETVRSPDEFPRRYAPMPDVPVLYVQGDR